jgi:hypothetical protein
MKIKRPIGVIFFSCLLIVTSLFQLNHIPPYSEYKLINKEVPIYLINIRFVISYILRIFGLASGIGIFCLNNNFRKILLGLSWFSIGTIYLRHTYKAFLIYTTPLYYHAPMSFSLQTFTWIAVLTSWTIEVAFSLSVISYFTRPNVVKCFMR